MEESKDDERRDRQSADFEISDMRPNTRLVDSQFLSSSSHLHSSTSKLSRPTPQSQLFYSSDFRSPFAFNVRELSFLKRFWYSQDDLALEFSRLVVSCITAQSTLHPLRRRFNRHSSRASQTISTSPTTSIQTPSPRTLFIDHRNSRSFGTRYIACDVDPTSRALVACASTEQSRPPSLPRSALAPRTFRLPQTL